VEILKVLYRGANILILDEPTAVLTPQEADELGAIMRNMANEGKAVIFISHKLDEIMAYADRVTVLRKGKNVATLEVNKTSKSELAQLMVGRDVLFRVEKGPASKGDVLVSLDDVSAMNDRSLPALKNASLEIRGGEILGIAGVAGNGQRELAEVVAGMRKVSGGRVQIRGKDMTNQPPLKFIRRDNLIMKSYNTPPISKRSFLRSGIITDFVRKLVQAFDVLTPNLETPARNLSGGNQQKAILAREITVGKTTTRGDEMPVLVAVYPTRGLDVGAIETVRRELLEQRANGVAILLVSEQLDELLALSDRIAVMHSGEIMGVVDADGADVDELGLMMAGERST
jgi:simple sugar transport system ATP-binding protein